MKLDGPKISRIRGDKAHPGSLGYTCEKALRLDHYQNAADRLTTPMRRRADGTYEPIDWDTAIAEVAAGLARVQAEYGGAPQTRRGPRRSPDVSEVLAAALAAGRPLEAPPGRYARRYGGARATRAAGARAGKT